MENLKLVKKDDRSFINPYHELPSPSNPLHDELRKKILQCANVLFQQWEKGIKEEINYTGMWNNYSVYTGISGYSLLYLHLGLVQGNEDYIEQAFFLAEKCSMHLHGIKNTFLCGDGGPLAIAAVTAHYMKQPEKEEHFIHRLEKMYRNPNILDFSCSMPDELLYGRAGCLYSLLFIRQHRGNVNSELISFIANSIVKSGQHLAEKLKVTEPSTPPLMYEWHDKKYLAAAHGMAGIIYLLLQVKEHLSSEILNEYIRPSLDFLLSTRFPSGNFPSSLGNGTDRLVQWCHGAPGFIHCFSKASQVFQSDVYLEAARKCADVVWERGILTKGFSLCHGMAGNGYGFLHLYQVTREAVYLHRACQFARFIVDAPPHEFRTPDHPFSLFEGMAGTIYFLHDLLNADTSSFPAFQIVE